MPCEDWRVDECAQLSRLVLGFNGCWADMGKGHLQSTCLIPAGVWGGGGGGTAGLLSAGEWDIAERALAELRELIKRSAFSLDECKRRCAPTHIQAAAANKSRVKSWL